MEKWKPISDLQYEVSNDGRVRNMQTGLILKPRKHSHGYLRVSLGASCEKYVHRLVCTAFSGEPPARYECDHINMQRDDNRASNLRWVTPEENKAHRRHPKGEARVQSKLRSCDVKVIRSIPPTVSNAAIGRRFGVHGRTISDVRKGVTWK